jgi:hypothetical protein
MSYYNYQMPNMCFPEDNDVLWRYMKIDKFEYLLNQSKIYMRRLSGFKDKQEGLYSNKTFKIVKMTFGKEVAIPLFLYHS